MFTGLVQAIGAVEARERRGQGHRLRLSCPFQALELGESIAVNGACLTVEQIESSGFFADVSLETHEKTTLGRLGLRSAVNLERALRVGDRIGGHFVSGHVDGVGQVTEVARVGDDRRIRMRLPAELMHLVAVKGSICLDGVSLTVNALRGNVIELMLIPHTLEATTLSSWQPGHAVNVEVDLLARHVERCLALGRAPRAE